MRDPIPQLHPHQEPKPSPKSSSGQEEKRLQQKAHFVSLGAQHSSEATVISSAK